MCFLSLLFVLLLSFCSHFVVVGIVLYMTAICVNRRIILSAYQLLQIAVGNLKSGQKAKLGGLIQ